MSLLKAIAAKDEAALAQLYDQYRAILFGLLLRILNNREEAEDVLQEVFIQVWRKAADFDENRGRPFTWLVTLTRSRGIDACEPSQLVSVWLRPEPESHWTTSRMRRPMRSSQSNAAW